MIVLGLDLIILPFALWASMSLRLGELFVPSGFRGDVIYFFFMVPFIAIPIFLQLGLYRAIIRYVGLVAMWTVIKGVTLYSLAFGVVILLSGIPGIPRSVLLINWLVTCLLIGGSRFIGRWAFSGQQKFTSTNQAKKRVAIYGAGAAGVQIASAWSRSPVYMPAAFIDDSKALQGNVIEGLRVYSLNELLTLIDQYSITDVVIAMPSVARSKRSQIIQKLEPYSVHVSTLPGLDDLVSGKVKVEDVREVGVLDLLGRIPVEPDIPLLNANIKNKVVLVTGAGGSIGSELCRQIIKIGPKKLILFERGEHDLYLIENELIELAGRLHPEREATGDLISPILASILNQERLESVCKVFGVQTVYHAAAYKHVPLVERNPCEAVRNNVLGTYKAALAAIDADVETFVLVSTDKAVRPTSTMGATKRFAEMILQGLAQSRKGKTRFTMVRFGNVLDSSGSVVPLFREQIQKGGPVTVTDPRITRYFMTIPEAAQLVIQAGAMGQGGDVFVLDMGEPVKILEMARRMIHLSGFEVRDESTPEGEIEIIYTGLRPGEKLYEELLIGENVSPTQNPLIMSANEDSLPWYVLTDFIKLFEETVESHDVDRSRELLVEAVMGFSPQCEVADLVQRKKLQISAKTPKDNIVRYSG
ncbi:MAG: polysaccharide biosynthesis protein [Gammaproteobacteria bacterium]|nr:polysaccharide biosynthesis protein [Gammaproteobacteria bacterium]